MFAGKITNCFLEVYGKIGTCVCSRYHAGSLLPTRESLGIYEASMYTYHRSTDLMRSLDTESAGLLLFRIFLLRLKV